MGNGWERLYRTLKEIPEGPVGGSEKLEPVVTEKTPEAPRQRKQRAKKVPSEAAHQDAAESST